MSEIVSSEPPGARENEPVPSSAHGSVEFSGRDVGSYLMTVSETVVARTG
ncbi:MAG: hypothetical protein BWY99_01785 [Synergistetes bacterium ADurb.BinA166]|nr:MAG: hypothetical protein BWY99_01785 [Synergistetes bacterium ADurb.BinA166]